MFFYNYSSVHQASLLAGMIPRMATPIFPVRGATPTTPSAIRTYSQMAKGISVMPQQNHKSPNSHMKPSPNSKGMSPTHSPNQAKGNHMKGMSPNHLKGVSPSPNHLKGMSPSPNQNNRTYSPVPANHLKGLSSPPQNPYSKKAQQSGGNSTPAPSYKKSSSSSNFPVYSGSKKPPVNPSYKSYNTKFKSSGNLTVINPDPNGGLQKLVIRNLDAKPTSPPSQKL